MRIGVPKEIKADEYRVGLIPAAVHEFVHAGHKVLVERGAGLGIGATDMEYERAGATVSDSAQSVFANADMIVKVKEPQPHEWAQLRPGQILFAYLHLAADREQALGLISAGCTAIAYETVTDTRGGLPLLAPMSEVAGRLSIEATASALRRPSGGKGLLIGGVPGVAPARILIVGGGVVGKQAARMAVGAGADVTVIDISLRRLQELDEQFKGQLRTRFATRNALEELLVSADAVIGAALIPGASAPKLVTRKMLSTMKPKSVLVDVSVDQGGCFETSRPTTHAAPTFEIDSIVHYCVANMPGSVPVTSSQALNHATLPFGLQLAAGGLEALIQDPNLKAGLNVHRGHVTCKAVADSLGLRYVDADRALGGA